MIEQEEHNTLVPANTFGHFHYPIILAVTLFATALAALFPAVINKINLPLFLLIIFIIGVPHGATDHVLDKFVEGRRYNLVRFLLKYTFIGIAYGLCWYLLPLPSLLLFIVLATYHFGQSQLLYVRLPHRNWLKVAAFMLWGSYTLCCLIFLNWAESYAILDELVPALLSLATDYIFLIPYLLAWLFFLNTALFVYFYKKGGLLKRELAAEVLNMLVIAALAYTTPLLAGFAIYFGLWHSLISIKIEVQAVKTRKESFSVVDFAKKAIPLSLSSYLIFFIIYWANKTLNFLQSPYLLFFILISILTLPHVIFIQRFYMRMIRFVKAPASVEKLP